MSVLFGIKVVFLSVWLGSDLANSAIVIGFGGCPSVDTMSDFNKALYLGKWYEYKRFSNWFERGLKCVFAEYTDNGDGSIGVRNGGVNKRTNEPESIEGKATIPDPSKPAELKVSFSNFDFSRGANYLLIGTDYTEAALIFSCTNIPFVPVTFQTAWILTRAQGVAPSSLEALTNSLDSYGIRSDKLNLIEQSDCP